MGLTLLKNIKQKPTLRYRKEQNPYQSILLQHMLLSRGEVWVNWAAVQFLTLPGVLCCDYLD